MTNSLGAALAAVDEANKLDPNHINGQPRALEQGRLATAWLGRLAADPSPELQLAARAHHLERWVLERSSYPEGRAGYLRWRRENKAHQAARAREIASTHAPSLSGGRLEQLLLRRNLSGDTETQLLEDIACLVFVETQFDDLAARLERDHLVTIVQRTLTKMSPEAIAAASSVDLSANASSVLDDAVASIGS